MNNRVLVVAAHADDETLGCGGTIARHVSEGDEVHLLLIADGVSSRTSRIRDDLKRRDAATDKAAKILGISSVERLRLADNRLDAIPLLEIARAVENIICTVTPAIVYTHHCGDLNVDHRCTQNAVMTACRALPHSSVREIYGFEVLSSTEWATPHSNTFIPLLYVDISEHLPLKMAALMEYSDEMRPSPHSRSLEHVKALALHRGYSAGVEAAEAFAVYRLLRR